MRVKSISQSRVCKFDPFRRINPVTWFSSKACARLMHALAAFSAAKHQQLLHAWRMAKGTALSSLSLRMGQSYLVSGAKYEGKDGICSGRRGKGEEVKKGWRSACLAVMRFSGS